MNPLGCKIIIREDTGQTFYKIPIIISTISPTLEEFGIEDRITIVLPMSEMKKEVI